MRPDGPRLPVSRPLPTALALPYAVYALAGFLSLSLVALLGVLLLPGLRARRGFARGMARLALRVAGMRSTLHDAHRLPAGQCVVIANHASYLDGIVLFALLPPRFAFVIKREMAQVPLAGLLLRRVGSEFVHRGRGSQGLRDARRVLKTATSGASLAFFPEGTFEPGPGLLRFHAGAFVAAARSQLPVVPLVIRGTRRALPPDSFLPAPGRIDVEVLEPLPAPAAGDDGVGATRDEARRRMLERLGEPDLAAASVTAAAAGDTP